MNRPSHTAYLSLGSNLGNRDRNLDLALARLAAEDIARTRVSARYETEPVGVGEQPWFLNIAVEVLTPLSPPELLLRCREVERAGGRERPGPGSARTIDLDILLFEDRVVREPDLTIPHPRMAERRFVLVPLAEIAPDVVHPVLGRSIRSLLEECRDLSIVRPSAPGEPRP